MFKMKCFESFGRRRVLWSAIFLSFFVFSKAPYIPSRVWSLPTASTYLKMIQWLNVRAVCAIKASMFEGRTLSPPSSSVSSYPPPSLGVHISARAGSRADVQTLSFRLRPHCQLRALLSLVACPGSFFPLSAPSRGQRRPYKATFLLILFCQFTHRQSQRWRKSELAVMRFNFSMFKFAGFFFIGPKKKKKNDTAEACGVKR